MVGLTTKIINKYIGFLAGRDPIIICWIKSYLKSSYRVGNIYLHYNGEVTHYCLSIDYSKAKHHKTNRLLVYNGQCLIANLGIYNFKKYCRTSLIRKIV